MYSIIDLYIFLFFRWEFKTDGYDIGFGLFYQGRSGREEIIKVDRVASHIVPEDGVHTCTRTGKCECTQCPSTRR